MAAIEPTNSTCRKWNCTESCRYCTRTCDLLFYVGTSTSSVVAVGMYKHEVRKASVATSDIEEKMPDESPEPEFYVPKYDIETIRSWRKLQRYCSVHKYNFKYKPTIKRRLSISKSGWLPRSVHKRKKGH